MCHKACALSKVIVRNKFMRRNAGVSLTEDQIHEIRLRLFWNVYGRHLDALMRSVLRTSIIAIGK